MEPKLPKKRTTISYKARYYFWMGIALSQLFWMIIATILIERLK